MRHCTMTYCYETLVRGALAHDTTFKHLRQRRCLTTMRTVQTYECLLIFLTPTQPKFYSKCDSCKKNPIPQCYIRHESVFRFFKDSVKKSNMFSSNISVSICFFRADFTSLKDSCFFCFFWQWPSFHSSHSFHCLLHGSSAELSSASLSTKVLLSVQLLFAPSPQC